MVLKERFKELEEMLLSAIIDFYGDRLITVALFGSIARGTQRFDSDVDLLIIAKDLPHGRIKRIREFEIIEETLDPFIRSLQKDGITTYISAIIKSPEEAEAGSPIFIDMVEDARILYDKGGFFARRLDKLRKRMTELGSKRIWRGNAWYWDLKPDAKAGENIEL